MVFNIHKAFFGTFCLSILSTTLAPKLVKFSDELCLFAFVLLALCDIIFNKNIRAYKLLGVLIGVLLFYLAYSILFSPYNTVAAQINDFIFQCKPLVAFGLAYAIAPRFSANEKHILKTLCLALGFLMCVFGLTGIGEVMMFHVYYLGLTCVSCIVAYALVAFDKNIPSGFSQKDLYAIGFLILCGLPCTRSKYYGFCIVVLYFLFLYKPGIFDLKKIKNWAILLGFIAIVLLVAWQKISYYYFSHDLDMYDIDQKEAFARPVLFGGMVLVLADHFWLGSGLASYATYSSGTSVNYSDLYYDYGINFVWGLSPDYCSFIADTFFPELAQFGIIGIVCFLVFCYWIWRKFRIVMRSHHYKLFAIGVISMLFFIIDGVGGCSVLQAVGTVLMVCMGIIASMSKSVSKAQAKELLKIPASDVYYNVKIKTDKRYDYEF